MHTYIAYDAQSRIRSIVMARSEEAAKAYWQGKGVTPFRIRTVGEISRVVGPEAVVAPILETRVDTGFMRGGSMSDAVIVVRCNVPE